MSTDFDKVDMLFIRACKIDRDNHGIYKRLIKLYERFYCKKESVENLDTVLLNILIHIWQERTDKRGSFSYMIDALAPHNARMLGLSEKDDHYTRALYVMIQNIRYTDNRTIKGWCETAKYQRYLNRK